MANQYSIPVNLIGQQFGRLTVMERLGTRNRIRFWRCKCECGNFTEVSTGHLRHGHTRSCGCLFEERKHGGNPTHGMSHSAEHNTWNCMRQRCLNENHRQFSDYGGRGIKVCERWLESFENFYADMGKRPSSKHSLDRKNNDGDYGPDNCRWATMVQQGNNTRVNHRITFNGRTQTVTEWSYELGVSSKTIFTRLARGLTVEQSLTKPIRGHGAPVKYS